MNIEFNHYPKITFNINENPESIKLPNTKDCVYYDMIKMLKFDDFLKDFWDENDVISTTCNPDEYEGNVIVFFQRGNSKQKKPLFCFCRETGLSGQLFYASIISAIKDIYSEELI